MSEGLKRLAGVRTVGAMNGGWNIGRIAGIPVRVHWTLLALGALVGLSQGAGALGTLIGAVLLFGSVVAHELGHALVGRLFGIETRDIVLTPIGGIARIEGMPKRGWAEVAIAIAGPIVSLAIAAVAFFASKLVAPVGIAAMVLGTLSTTNAMLGLFNLIPAFPMDGGRVLRGVLHERIGLLPATQLAARVGRVAAVLMGIGGLAWANVSLVLIAVFVWTSTGQELRAAEAQRARERLPEAWDAFGRPIPVELVPSVRWAPRRPMVATYQR